MAFQFPDTPVDRCTVVYWIVREQSFTVAQCRATYFADASYRDYDPSVSESESACYAPLVDDWMIENPIGQCVGRLCGWNFLGEMLNDTGVGVDRAFATEAEARVYQKLRMDATIAGMRAQLESMLKHRREEIRETGEQCCERDFDHDGNCDPKPVVNLMEALKISLDRAKALESPAGGRVEHS